MSRYARERMWIVFVLALAICAVLTFVRHQYEKRGVDDPITDITRRFLFSPVLHGTSSFSVWWNTDVASVFRGPQIAAQNRRLRSKIANLMQENRILSDEAVENVQLRALLSFKSRDARDLLPAEILALKPFAERDSAIFSRGLTNSVKIKEPALDQNGNLVGQVTDVSSTTCDVLLLTDTLSSVGARIEDSQSPTASQAPVPETTSETTSPTATPPQAEAPATVGICVGDRSNLLQLTDLSSDADVAVGDTVVTSGLGGVYPKDIPIGRVIEVDSDKTTNLKSAVVEPFADFNHLQDGFLIQ